METMIDGFDKTCSWRVIWAGNTIWDKMAQLPVFTVLYLLFPLCISNKKLIASVILGWYLLSLLLKHAIYCFRLMLFLMLVNWCTELSIIFLLIGCKMLLFTVKCTVTNLTFAASRVNIFYWYNQFPFCCWLLSSSIFEDRILAFPLQFLSISHTSTVLAISGAIKMYLHWSTTIFARTFPTKLKTGKK